jgi:transcriptional regulator with XRE-family HTH domain
MTVNGAVCALRKYLGLTQQAFANYAGISISALNNYERHRTPEARRLYENTDYSVYGVFLKR